MRPQLFLGVDGGASKTDAVLVDREGAVAAAVRLPASGHVGIGHEAGFGTVSAAVARAAEMAHVEGMTRVAQSAAYCLAGIDLPLDERRASKHISEFGWSCQNRVLNDTFAVLRAGIERTWGVAVTCGSGLNCVGVSPAGTVARFASLGLISGDLAHGGDWLGVAAVGATIRAADGRGPRTRLEGMIAKHFSASSPKRVLEGLYSGTISRRRTLELPPLVFRAAEEGDPVARELIEKLAGEIVAMATAAIRRLHLTRQDVHVVLGGGNFRNDDRLFTEMIVDGIKQVAPRCLVGILDAPPVLGAVLLALDVEGVSESVADRVRSQLTHGRMTRARLDAKAGV